MSSRLPPAAMKVFTYSFFANKEYSLFGKEALDGGPSPSPFFPHQMSRLYKYGRQWGKKKRNDAFFASLSCIIIMVTFGGLKEKKLRKAVYITLPVL